MVVTMWKEHGTGEFRARILDGADSPEHLQRSIVVATAPALLRELKTILNEFTGNN